MNRTTRFLVVLLVAVALAAAASYAVYIAVQRMPVREVEVGTVPTVVAARAIPVGTLLTRDDVKVVAWPAKAPIPGAHPTIDTVVNRGVIQPLAENEPITDARLAPVGTGGGLPPTIPAGMRAISVRVNEVIGVAGFVVPGTRVDVVVITGDRDSGVSRVVVNNVQVLTAGTRFDQEKAREDGKPMPTSVVTLLVTPEDAERIALAQSQGQLMLTLRNPLDTAPVETTGVRMTSLMGAPNPAPVEKTVQGRRVMRTPKPAPEVPAAPKAYTVETIRGAKRTEEEVR